MYLTQTVCVFLYAKLGLDCWNNTASHPISKKAIKQSLIDSIEDSWELNNIDDGSFIIDEEFKTTILQLIKSFVRNATASSPPWVKSGINIWLGTRTKNSPLAGVHNYPENLDNKMKMSNGRFKDYLGLQIHETPTYEAAALTAVIKYSTSWPTVIHSKCAFLEDLKFGIKTEKFTTIFGDFIHGVIDEPKLRFIILPLDKIRKTVVVVPVNKTTADEIYDGIDSIVSKILKVDQVRNQLATETQVSLPPITFAFSAYVVALTKGNTISIAPGTENNCDSEVQNAQGGDKFLVDRPFVAVMMWNRVMLASAIMKKIN